MAEPLARLDETATEEASLDETLSDDEVEAIAREVAAAAPIATVERDDDDKNLQQRFIDMSMGEKVRLALTGSRAARSLILRTNKPLLVNMVLKNPRLTVDEVVELAKLKTTATDILEAIQRNRSWMKGYQLKLILVMNPKTSAASSMRLMGHLLEADLRRIAKSRDVPQIVANTARRLLSQRAKN